MFHRSEKRGLILGDGRRSGMTLLELLISMSVMVMVMGALGALARGVQLGFQYAEGHGLATQHARVILDRIGRTVREATANDQFPGVIVLAETEGSWRFPDTLVVWNPDGDPVDPDGLPRFDELVIYCPNWSTPNQLVEITVPTDPRTVPPVENQAQWAAEIEAIKTANSSQVVTLTEIMHTGLADDLVSTSRRAALRFETRLRPSQIEWDDYRDGNKTWDELSWVQGIYGSQTGLRQVWLRTELQLTAGEQSGGAPNRQIPFPGSVALYYEMHK